MNQALCSPSFALSIPPSYVFLEYIIKRHNDRPLKILSAKTPMYSAFTSISSTIPAPIRERKEGFNTSFGKDTYIAVESVMLRKAHEVRVSGMCVVCRRNQNASTTIKSGAALVSNEKLWCGMNTENVPLIRVLEPASCPWKNCQGLVKLMGSR